MNFFHHKDLGIHLLQLCPKVVKHPVYTLYVDAAVVLARYVLSLCVCVELCGVPDQL